jgi:hypothetical protein
MDKPKLYGPVKPHSDAPEALESVRSHFSVYEFPESLMMMMGAANIIARDWGFLKSAEMNEAVDAAGEPLPLLSYALIEYLSGLDLSGKSVFEFGSGQSTFYWSSRVKSVHSVESDAEWAAKIGASKPANCRLDVVAKGAMPRFFEDLGQTFDIIVVDCAENRYECCRVARERLAAGGFIILDNSDWHPNSARLLRESGLMQVDFFGLRPCHHYACATSVFFDRAFAPNPREDRLPRYALGGKRISNNRWDEPIP